LPGGLVCPPEVKVQGKTIQTMTEAKHRSSAKNEKAKEETAVQTVKKSRFLSPAFSIISIRYRYVSIVVSIYTWKLEINAKKANQ
jgi:hypothetical protein